MNLRYWSNENNLIDLDEVIAIEVRIEEKNVYGGAGFSSYEAISSYCITKTVLKYRNGIEHVVYATGILEQFKEYKSQTLTVHLPQGGEEL